MDLAILRVVPFIMLVHMSSIMAEGATLFSELSNSLTVSVTGADNTSPNGTKAGADELLVTWALNSAAQVDDSSYKTVELKLCFGAPSQVDRAWRKTNDILSKDKTCGFKIASPQPYNRAGNTTKWLVGKEIPFAHYFVRAYVLDSAGEKVAYGQSSNAQRTSNLFTIEPISGRHASIDIAAAVFSAFSVISLFGFFFYEKMSKRTSKA
ncbi:hypothetical protein KP509_27G020500 [Ceratopteris richardii]|uniref:High-affinity nitrate transporter n=1 Tax=Ceratopteris richardii TaxID=49495 RepID=A0A8T2RG76_CERRI|nr:hypothetical protein KP509_27G020500 [Ceratopteris richardii]KAH7294825.1 hypothetical protein KP509_27G020500 [Ceratopteris richardii]